VISRNIYIDSHKMDRLGVDVEGYKNSQLTCTFREDVIDAE
jgi:hypothetical protein